MTPLNDLVAEQNVLGILLMDPTLLGSIRTKLSTGDFDFADHQKIWSVLCECEDLGIPITQSTLHHRLEGQLRTNDHLYLANLDGLPSTLDHFAGVLLRKSNLRRLRELGRTILDAVQADEDPERIVARIETFVRGFGATRKNTVVTASDTARASRKTIEEIQDKGTDESFKTGLEFLDGNVWFKSTDLNVIGGRPTAGKSWLVISLARTIAEQGKGVLYVSAEMPAEDLVMRGAKSYAELNDDAFRKRVTPEEANLAIDAVSQFGKLPIWFTTTTDASVVMRLAREMVRQKQIQAVIVDFLQRLRLPGDWGRNRDEQLGHCTSDMKQFALEQRCPVFLVSSMKRPSDQNAKARPTMASLRESGNIESDADNIVLLHRTSGDAVDFLVEKGRAKKDQRVIKMRRAFHLGGFERMPESQPKTKESVEPPPDSEPDDQYSWGQS